MQHAAVRQTKTASLFDTRLTSMADLVPINPDTNEVPPPHPLEPGCNLSIPHCLLSGGGRRFRTGGPESYFLYRWWMIKSQGGLGTDGSMEIAVGRSEIRLVWRITCHPTNCFKGESARTNIQEQGSGVEIGVQQSSRLWSGRASLVSQ